VVVWTSYGQDDPADTDGAGVYMRMFDRDNEPLTNEFLVNTTVEGDQWRPAVAIDADGEFVVVWQSDEQDPDGSAGIYARRFSSIGEPLGGEFRVNTNYTNDQYHPALAMDDDGNFTVVWGTAGQTLSYFNDIMGQMFNRDGDRVGSEFRVNTVNVPGVVPAPGGGNEVAPAIGMNGSGNFLVAWEQVTAQENGVVTDTEVVARAFDPDGTPAINPISGDDLEFRVDTAGGQGGQGVSEARTARNPQVAVDEQGNFYVSYEFYTGTPGVDGYYATFTELMMVDGSTPGAWAAPPLPIMLYGEADYVNPTLAVDADGDWGIVLNGHYAELDVQSPTNPLLVINEDTAGAWLVSIDAANELISTVSRVNQTGYGDQRFPCIAMEPDGDTIIVWSGYGVGDDQGVFARRYDELTDTAGPTVTDYLLPSGVRIAPDMQITEPLTHIVVVFDEEMLDAGLDAVTNPDNYHLLKSGVPIAGGISYVDFGLNSGTNKWEAVLHLDGNGVEPGTPPILEGQLELVCMNSLRDVAGNPLGSTGLLPDGESNSQRIDVIVPDGEEIRVNFPDGEEHTYPHGQPAVAADADGDYVVVWTDEAQAHLGVYAKLYDVDWTDTAAGRVSTVAAMPVRQPSGAFWPNNEILVTGDPTASYAAVARDIDGDFVVTWSQWSAETDWDIYARRYDAAGNALTGPFLVNSETENIQQFSSVAMDGDGDFVITWQSYDQEDNDSYDIYAQRYSPEGYAIDGSDELQMLEFVGNPTGTFVLRWDHDKSPYTADLVTTPIAFAGNTFDTAQHIENALVALGADVDVEAFSLTEIAVRFVGADGGKDQAPLAIDPTLTHLTGDPGAQIIITTRADGSAGEFRVNDTIENHQMWPSLDMSTNGNFVISWTSFGQGDDLPYESDIYAKRFPANDVIWGHNPNRPTSAQNLQTSARIDGAHYQPLIVSVDDPVNHEVAPGVGYDGVVQVFAGTAYGSGTLLTGGNYVLTASHVVWDDFAGAPIDPSLIQVAFDTPAGRVMMPAWDVFVAPGYNGDPFVGGDVAVVMLAGSAPAGVETHDIYRASDELGRLGDKYGYGLIGTGDTGYTTGSGDLKRSGWNRYETLGSMVGASDELLVYDFDNGLPENDALGQVFGVNDLGEGLNEICAAPGDSGGPTFVDGKVAAVTTGLVQMPGPHDVVPGTNSSFGDFGMDTRVSLYADWIDSITSFGGYEFRVNEDDPLLDEDGIQVVDDDGNPVFIDNDGSNQKWSSVAMDANGDFVITWTSYGHDGVGSGYGAGADGLNGIYARRYEVFNPGIPWNDAFQVNSFAEYDQQYSRVAMDADGDFVITWESFQDRPASPVDDTPNSFGIYAQRYVRSELIGQEAYGPDGELGGELEVNSTKAGDQRYPGVAMDDAGDFVIVWSGNGEVPGQQDDQGVFSRRYDKSEDEAGPTVGDVLNVVVDGSGNIQLLRVLDGAVLQVLPTQFVVTLGEEVSTEGIASGTHSIMNPYNWQLTKDGAPVAGGVREVRGPNLADPTNLLNPATQKYEAIVTFDGDPLTAGLQPLERGVYILTLKDSVEDIFENPFDGDFDGKPQVDFVRTFSVLTAMPGETEPGTPGAPGSPSLPGDPDPESEDVSINTFWEGDQDNPVVASNDHGDHVIIWVTHNAVGEGTIRGQRFNRLGQPEGNEFVVSTFSSGNQIEPDVAMDRFGNFVVTWSGVGEVDEAGVFARVFDPYGDPLGEQFRVNQERNYIQDAPTVAMDANGDFVVVWTTFGAPEGDRNLFARRFTFLGEPLSNEFQVNTTMLHGQDDSDVAMDHDGNFVVVWNSWSQDGGGWSIIGRRFNSSGVPLGGEFRVNQHATDNQHLPQVAMDADGDFVVVWQSWLQDGSQYGTYARRYDRAGTPVGGEFLVNQTTAYGQRQAAVSMDDDGRFVVTWTSFGQDNQNVNEEDDGVYARIYNPDGSDFLDLETGLVMGEFRVNATEEGNQHSSAVAMDSDGDFVVAWVAPSTQPVDPESDIDRGSEIYRRVVALNPESYYGGTGASGGFLAGGYLGGGGGNPGPATVVVTGTTGDDTFEFVGAAAPGAWIVRLNGQLQNVGSNAVAVVFDGLGGNDTVSLSGTGGNDIVELWGDQGTLTGDGYSATVSHVETITAEGLGGEDHATLHDSAGNDEFISWPFGAMMVTSTGSNTVTGFEAIVGNAGNGGYDKARFYDSAGDDTFVTVPSYGLLFGEGYSNQAVSFDEVHAYATGGGYDITRMYDSPGDDTFYATPLETALYGDGFFNRAKYFKEVHGYASAGGEDVGFLFDSDGNDTFYATPTEGAMYGDGYFNRAKFFEKMRGDASLGGSDGAVLYDSPGQDLFIASPTFASLSGDGFDNQATNFDEVLAYATLTDGFYDQARLYDSPGDDLFWTTPTYGALMGNGFYNQAAGFDGVNAYGFAGGHDTAKLYDSPGDDTFYATAIEGMIWGPGFYHRAKNFEVVSAFATAGGIDEAHLFDSAGDDVFYANSVEKVIFNNTFYNRAKFFEKVYAHSETGGDDTAYLFDAALENGLTKQTGDGLGIEYAKIAWLYDFEQLYATDNSSSNKPVVQAVDTVMTAYWP